MDSHSDLQVDALEERAEQVVQEAHRTAVHAGVDLVREVVECGSAIHRTIRSYVDENERDNLVMGIQGRTGIDRYLLGSVTAKIVPTASVSVLTVTGAGSDGEHGPANGTNGHGGSWEIASIEVRGVPE